MAIVRVMLIVILVNMSYLIDVVVLNSSNCTMSVYGVDADWNSEAIEEMLVNEGHKLTEASWAVIHHFPEIFHVVFNGADTWGYMTKEAFYKSLNETNRGKEPEDWLTEDKFILEPITIQY